MEKIPNLVKEVLITQQEIKELVEKLASQIISDYKDKEELNMVIVLEGSKTFCADLAKVILAKKDIKINQYFIKVQSYRDKTVAGEIEIKKDIQDVAGKDLLVVEDIVDSGKTLKFLINYLKKVKNASNVKICSLLNKPARREVDVRIDYLGRDVPDKFVVGYGVDYAGKFRELPFVAVLDESKIGK